jgi:hypothetical protein
VVWEDGGGNPASYPILAARWSRFNFSGQLLKVGRIAAQLLRQTTDYCPGRDYLPLIIRSNSIGSMPSLAASLMTSVPRVAHKSAMCLLKLINFRLWHFG